MDRLLRCPPVLHKRPSGRVAWPSDVWQEVEAEARSHLVGPALVLAERFARFNDESIALSDDGVDHVVEVLDHLAEQATQDSLSAKSQNSPMGPLRHRLREPTIESAPIRDALALVLNELLRTPSPWEPNQLELFAENPARDEIGLRGTVTYPMTGLSPRELRLARQYAEEVRDVGAALGIDIFVLVETTGDRATDIRHRNVEAIATSDVVVQLASRPAFGLGVTAAWAQALTGGMVVLGDNASPLVDSHNTVRFNFGDVCDLRRCARVAITMLYPDIVSNAEAREQIPAVVEPLRERAMERLAADTGMRPAAKSWLEDMLSGDATAAALPLKQWIRILGAVNIEAGAQDSYPSESAGRVRMPSRPAKPRRTPRVGLDGNERRAYRDFCARHKPSAIDAGKVMERALILKAQQATAVHSPDETHSRISSIGPIRGLRSGPR